MKCRSFQAVVFTPDTSISRTKAVQMFVDEIAARTQIRMPITHTPPKDQSMISITSSPYWVEEIPRLSFIFRPIAATREEFLKAMTPEGALRYWQALRPSARVKD
jgi:hypothetical protein